MSRLGVGNRNELEGCTARQIQRLEKRHGITIPESYRCYLKTMGHDSARLFSHDWICVTYAHVIELTNDARSFLANCADDRPADAHKFKLPDDALVILYRDANDDFNFIRCNRADDSSVWHFNQDIWPPRAVFRSVYTWLKAWCDEASIVVQKGDYS